MADSPLDAIVATATAEPPELPRLQTGMVFLQYMRLRQAIERAAAACARIPDCTTPESCTNELRDILKVCEGISKTAQRLLDANR